jgi:H+/Cl- antiporter ClcA
MSTTTVLLLIDIGIYITYALLGLAVLGALVAAVRGLFANPKGLKMVLVGLVGVAIVLFISWVFSSGADISEVLLDKTGTSQWWVRPVGTGLFAFYILLASTILLLIGTEVARPFKK